MKKLKYLKKPRTEKLITSEAISSARRVAAERASAIAMAKAVLRLETQAPVHQHNDKREDGKSRRIEEHEATLSYKPNGGGHGNSRALGRGVNRECGHKA